MNNENQMREELLKHNGLKHEEVSPQEMQTYQSKFIMTRIYVALLTLICIILWFCAAVSHIVFSVNAFLLASSDSRNHDVMTMIIAGFSEPFLFAAAGILTYYLFSRTKQRTMFEIQKRLRLIEQQLKTNENQ